MRSYLNSAAAPELAPLQPGPRPEVVPARPGAPPPRRIWPIPLVIAIAAACAVWYWQQAAAQRRAESKPHAVTVRTAVVRKGTINRTLRVGGTVSAVKFSTMLAPQLRGHRGSGYDFSLQLEYIVPNGSRVKKGDVLARFDMLAMENRMRDYDAMIQQYEANLRNLRALLDVRRQSYAQQIIRYKGAMDKAELDLKKREVLSAINSEKLRLNYEQWKAAYAEIAAEMDKVVESETASIRRSELSMKQARMEWQGAKNNLEKMIPKAPMDGIAIMLSQSSSRSGETRQLKQGDQLNSGQPFLRIMDISSMMVNGDVNQVDVDEIRLGQKAVVRLDAYPGLEVPAEVQSVGAYSKATGWRGNYVRSVPVRLKILGRDARILPDLSVSADITVRREADVTMVPRECVFGAGDSSYALVRRGAEWERQPVELGMADNLNVAVRGLNEGDTVAAELPGTSKQ